MPMYNVWGSKTDGDNIYIYIERERESGGGGGSLHNGSDQWVIIMKYKTQVV